MRDRRTKSPWLLSGRERATCCADFSGRPFLLNLLLGPVGGKKREREFILNDLRETNFQESRVLAIV